MTEFRFDTYCGLYCGACDILQAYKKGIETGTSPQWRDLPLEIQNHPVIPKNSEIKCHGCKTGTIFAGCSKCIIRKCAINKTGVETCLDCGNYPCWRLKLTAIFKKLLKLETRLPHLKDIAPNLEIIRNNGMEFWLEEQNRKWQCPNCGKRLSWYQASCPECRGEH